MVHKSPKLLMFCLLTGLGSSLFLAPSSHAQAEREIGSIVTTRGLVSLRDAAGGVRKAERRGALHEGDTIVVEAGGFASLRMIDNAHLSLGPATEFAFERYRFDGKASTRDSVVLRLLRGCFRTTSGVAGAVNRDEYRVATPLANIDVDASFHGAALVGDRLYTATWDGATVVSNALGSLNLGNYGDYEYSRTLPGEAPKGMKALLPETACEPPAVLDGAVEPSSVTLRDRDRRDDDEAEDEAEDEGEDE